MWIDDVTKLEQLLDDEAPGQLLCLPFEEQLHLVCWDYCGGNNWHFIMTMLSVHGTK